MGLMKDDDNMTYRLYDVDVANSIHLLKRGLKEEFKESLLNPKVDKYAVINYMLDKLDFNIVFNDYGDFLRKHFSSYLDDIKKRKC